MRRFNFRLEKLLELRRYEEREWELKLARVTGECLVLERRIAENRRLIGTGVTPAASVAGQLDVRQLIDGDLYIRRLYQEITELKTQLKGKQQERQQLSAEYLRHSRRRKVLEKLKEKRAFTYYQEQRQEEFKVLDEINDGAESRSRVREM